MWHLTACKKPVSLSFLKWMIFYLISELMLPAFIQINDNDHFILIQLKNERLTEILQAVRCHIL